MPVTFTPNVDAIVTVKRLLQVKRVIVRSCSTFDVFRRDIQLGIRFEPSSLERYNYDIVAILVAIKNNKSLLSIMTFCFIS